MLSVHLTEIRQSFIMFAIFKLSVMLFVKLRTTLLHLFKNLKSEELIFPLHLFKVTSYWVRRGISDVGFHFVLLHVTVNCFSGLIYERKKSTRLLEMVPMLPYLLVKVWISRKVLRWIG